jgi:hypothetical protein
VFTSALGASRVFTLVWWCPSSDWQLVCAEEWGVGLACVVESVPVFSTLNN